MVTYNTIGDRAQGSIFDWGLSVPDANPYPDPPDPRVFWPPGFGSFDHHAKIIRKTLNPTIL